MGVSPGWQHAGRGEVRRATHGTRGSAALSGSAPRGGSTSTSRTLRLKRFVEFDSYKFHGNRDKYVRDARRRLMLRDHGWDFVVVTDDEFDSGCELSIRVLAKLLADAERR